MAVEVRYRSSLRLITCNRISRRKVDLAPCLAHLLSLSFFSHSPYTPLRSTLLSSVSRSPFFPSLLISTLIFSNRPSISLNCSSSSLRLLVPPFSSLATTLFLFPQCSVVFPTTPSVFLPSPISILAIIFTRACHVPTLPFVIRFYSGIVDRSIPDNGLWFLLTCGIRDRCFCQANLYDILLRRHIVRSILFLHGAGN